MSQNEEWPYPIIGQLCIVKLHAMRRVMGTVRDFELFNDKVHYISVALHDFDKKDNPTYRATSYAAHNVELLDPRKVGC